MNYTIKTAAGTTLVEAPFNNLKIEVKERQPDVLLAGLPYALGTLYAIKGGFVPVKTFVFQITGAGQNDLEALKDFMDFFFTNVLDTELYVKEVPQDSALFAQESVRLFGGETVKV